MIRYVVLTALTLGAIALTAGAAALFAVGEITGGKGWTVGAIVAGGGAVFLIGRLRDYAYTH